MAIAFDGSFVPDTLPAMPCGGIPEFDDGSGYAYRCDQCGAVVGSIGMPSKCQSALDAQKSNGVDIYDAVKEARQSVSPKQLTAVDIQSAFTVLF